MAGNACAREHVARIRDVHAAAGDAEVAGLLVGERVHYSRGDLEEERGGDGVKVLDGEGEGEGFPPSLYIESDGLADKVVKDFLQRKKRSEDLTRK